MGRITGRYVATVALEVETERTDDAIPLELIRENIYGITDALTNLLTQLGDFSKVEVIPQLVDATETEE